MKRDDYGIIIQPDGAEVDGKIFDDGGDSAFSTGLAAFGGSEFDARLMPSFIVSGQLVRHPFQAINTGTAPHNDPKATSRDQVIAFFAGTVHNWTPRVARVCLTYAEGWRVNRDVLSPADKLYLYKAAQEKIPAWLAVVGRIWMVGEILVSALVNPKHEVNQISVKAYTFGRWWLWALFKLHPDLFGNLTEYFSGWRERGPIAVAMIQKLEAKIEGEEI
jgi:hypothetical protein